MNVLLSDVKMAAKTVHAEVSKIHKSEAAIMDLVKAKTVHSAMIKRMIKP